MLISFDWLHAFVPHGETPESLRDLMSAHVATVDGMEQLRADLRPIIIARVLSAVRHPDSDHLWVTKVDDGSGTQLDVVCGAQNVVEGALYPFARVGTIMPTGNKGGILIERRRIRGALSNGMLCSARELGLGEDHDGIMALDLDAQPGTPLLEAMQIGDVRYDVDVLPNRPDLLNHLGMAREIAAITGTSLRLPEELGGEPEPTRLAAGAREASSAGVTVRIEDAAGCPRYMGVVIRGVGVGPSPAWLARRVESVGMRSISNIVDITNYMMHGFGQPMHAFDLAALANRQIVVRCARRGERMTTLDGVDRTFAGHETIITDGQRPIAIAGVMGGLDSEVKPDTQDIFLEVAYFDPGRTRAARRSSGVISDASYRFERGIDPEGSPRALAIAAQLLCAVAGGRVDGVPIDVGAPPSRSAQVTLRPARLSRLLGEAVEAGEIARRLESIGFAVSAGRNDALVVSVPSWRHDVSRDVDLVEEVARLRGYDALSDELKPFRPGTVPDHPFYEIARRLRDSLVGRGLAEVRPLPFVRGEDATHVRVQNPIAENEPHLRTSVLETLAHRAAHNLTRMQGDVRIFEIGSVFSRGDLGSGGRPREEVRVGALIMGARRPPHFTESKVPAFDAWDARALGEGVARVACPGTAIVSIPGHGDVLWRLVSDSGESLGTIERIALDRPAWASEAFGVEISLGRISNAPVAPPGSHAPHEPDPQPRAGHVRFTPLPTTPAAEFDLALVVPDRLMAEQVESAIRRSAGDLLERLVLFDEYRGRELPAGHRSIAWRLTFRDPVRTLRDKEIEGRRQKILRTLEGELGVRARSV
ncbi:MAG: Phenylalanine--tRNA ligase beta subunit [Gemmatimonadaceae bacterium]|nr:Phenylalanine--tRNA ligase beta subunit [Gemmatimonadaceae bacterium]